AQGFDLGVDLLQGFLGNDRPQFEVAVPLFGDLHALREVLIHLAELELVHHQPRQQVGVAGVLDLHLPQHAGDDDLDVLVVDVDALAAVDRLDFVHQVLLHGLFAGNTQDVVRHQRTFDQGLARLDVIAGVDEESLAVRHQVLALDPRLAADDDRPLAAALLAQDFHHAVDLGDNRRILRLAGFEDFRHARQTARDVGNARSLARRLGDGRTGRDHLPLFGD